MADEPQTPGNGEEAPKKDFESLEMLAAFSRIRDATKRRIISELVRAIADDQSEPDGRD